MINFEKLSNEFERKSTSLEQQNERGIIYAYHVVFHGLDIEDIDFNRFTIEDLITVVNEIEFCVIDEDTDGRIYLDKKHPLTLIKYLGKLSWTMEHAPKIKLPSRFVFL